MNLIMKLNILPFISTSCVVVSPFFLNNLAAQAQTTPAIAPDGTTTSTVTGDGKNFTIRDGNRAGGNLFHSFDRFSVPTNGSAFFDNAPDVVNIINRVTGVKESIINGLLRANGSANLFLINPAGILFGNNASLDIGGSFFGSTADSLLFENGEEFSATDPETPSTLIINAPIGFSLRDNPQPITNRSTINNGGLYVNPGESINFIGGNINFEGGKISAPGSTVQLGGLSAAGKVEITESGSLNFPDGIQRADVNLTDAASVFVAAGGGGFINVNTRNLNLSGSSQLFTGIGENTGSPNAQAGDININATGAINLSQSNLFNLVLGEGNAGDINIEADSLVANADFISNSTSINSSNFGQGNAGNVNITVGTLTFQDGFRLLAFTQGQGNAANITINASGDISLINDSNIQSQVLPGAEGNAGNITINTDGSLFSRGGNLILADSQGMGNSANIIINAADTVLLEGLTNFPSQLVAQLTGEAQGEGGDITVNARELIMDDVAFISSSSASKAIGSPGNININVQSLSLANNAFISALTNNDSPGGEININAQNLNLSSGGKLIGTTDGSGDAGSINLNISDSITFDNSTPSSAPFAFFQPQLELDILNELQSEPSGIFANATRDSTGKGGSVNIGREQAPRVFTIANGAQIRVDSLGQGNGGNLFIKSNSFSLDGNASISATTASGQGGNITLGIDDTMYFRNNSSISARATGEADGGNIDVNANFVITFPNQNNDMIASAENGDGGNIEITAEGIFGAEERQAIPGNSTNDIDVSSDFGLEGSVNINTPDTDIQTATELPSNPVKIEPPVSGICSNNIDGGGSSLTLQGRGGLPQQPTDPLSADALLIGGEIRADRKLEEVDQVGEQGLRPTTNEQEDEEGTVYIIEEEENPEAVNPDEIIPARGMIYGKNGEIILVGYPTPNVAPRIPYKSPNCGI
jgi:filamentous hemagglutinin family protein